MSTVATSQLANKIATAQRQKRAAGIAGAVVPAAPETHVGLGIAPGARVIDLVTGEEGVILAGTITHTLIQPSKPDASKGTPG